jgi:hypothetical protein
MQSHVINTANAAESALAEVSVLIDDLDRGGDDDDGGDRGNGADGSGGGRKTGGAKSGTREASAVPEAVDPETTAPYRIPRKTTGNHPVAPSRSGGIVLDLPTP